MPARKKKQPPIELNDQFQHALDLMENSRRSLFITGRAGTGKSTLLTYFRGTTKKRVVVLAPTGVAALNVRGQTIHSFFRFKPNITLDKIRRSRGRDDNIYTNLDAIIIDEVSMVRADLMDCVDRFLRLNGPQADEPFGGIQMILIGDLYQLPPVVTSTEREAFKSLYETPYFYSAAVFKDFEFEIIELEKVYRQHDQEFIDLLNSIRNRSITEGGLALLNQRYLPDFEPPRDGFFVYLTTTNRLAEEVNNRELARLKTPQYVFTAEIKGDFGKEYIPTAVELQVKPGAQIMMLNNDSSGRWVNGTVGQITGIYRQENGEHIIAAELAEGDDVEITPFTWEIFRYYISGGQLQSEVVGKFTQYPLMLAWAVTIHKSQGKTFDRVIIDIGGGTFAHGQTYVAVSRCTSLEGVVLKRPIMKKDILTDWKVADFLTKYQYRKAEEACPAGDKSEIIEKAIREGASLRIVYLKPDDEKSERVIRPISIGEMEYLGKKYTGVRAFCFERNAERTFRIDRILKIDRA